MKFSLHVYTTQQPYFCLLLKFFCKLGTFMSPLGENNFVFYGSDFNPGSFLRTPCGFTHCFIFIEFTSIKNQMTWDLIQYVYNCVFSLRVFTACFHCVFSLCKYCSWPETESQTELSSLPSTLPAKKVHEDIIFGQQDILYILISLRKKEITNI